MVPLPAPQSHVVLTAYIQHPCKAKPPQLFAVGLSARTFSGHYPFLVLFTAKSLFFSGPSVLRTFSCRAAQQKSWGAGSAIRLRTGHSLVEMFALVFHYAELLWLLFTGHPGGTSEEEEHKPHQIPAKLISVNGTVAPACATWVSFCSLVFLWSSLFAISTSVGL